MKAATFQYVNKCTRLIQECIVALVFLDGRVLLCWCPRPTGPTELPHVHQDGYTFTLSETFLNNSLLSLPKSFVFYLFSFKSGPTVQIVGGHFYTEVTPLSIVFPRSPSPRDTARRAEILRAWP